MNKVRLLLSGSTIGLMFTGLCLTFPVTIPMILMGAAASVFAGAGVFVLATDKEEKEVEKITSKQVIKNGRYVSAKDAQQAIDEARPLLNEISSLANRITSPHIKVRIRNLAKIGNEIVDNFYDDPDDVQTANVWLKVYLKKTVELIDEYAKLLQKGIKSTEAQEALSNFDITLTDMEGLFKEQREILISNDIANLEVKSDVYKKRIY